MFYGTRAARPERKFLLRILSRTTVNEIQSYRASNTFSISARRARIFRVHPLSSRRGGTSFNANASGRSRNLSIVNRGEFDRCGPFYYSATPGRGEIARLPEFSSQDWNAWRYVSGRSKLSGPSQPHTLLAYKIHTSKRGQWIRKRKVIFPVYSVSWLMGNDRQNFNESYKWTSKQSKETRERERWREGWCRYLVSRDVVPALISNTMSF